MAHLQQVVPAHPDIRPQDVAPGAVPVQSLRALNELGRSAREAAHSDVLAFLLVNDSHLLAPYRQSALWLAEGGVRYGPAGTGYCSGYEPDSVCAT